MKAIVLESRDGFAVLLRDDGEIVKLRMNAQVGETVEISEKPLRLVAAKTSRFRTAIAASLAFAIAGGSYTYLSVPASAYVSLDAGESSVELAVNRLGRIVSVKPKNEASVALSDALTEDVRGKQMDVAIRKTVECLKDEGTLANEENCLIAGVTSNAPTTESVITQIVEEVTTSDGEEPVELYTITVTEEERQEAEANEQSAGNYAFKRRKMRRDKRRQKRREQRRKGVEEATQEQITQTDTTTENVDAVQVEAVEQEDEVIEFEEISDAPELSEEALAEELATPAEETTLPPAQPQTEAPIEQPQTEASIEQPQTEAPIEQSQTEASIEQPQTETPVAQPTTEDDYESDNPEFTEEREKRRAARKEERRRQRKQQRKEQRKKERQERREKRKAKATTQNDVPQQEETPETEQTVS